MKMLAVFDAKDYQDTVDVYEKYSVRGIIRRDGRLAMQCSSGGEYKIPGGGPEEGEDFQNALIREIREETGLSVRPETISELGEILEKRRDLFDPRKQYICHSLFYSCEAGEEQAPLKLTASEIAKGYRLRWATPEEIYRRNMQIETEPWIVRDTAFVKMILDKKVILP